MNNLPIHRKAVNHVALYLDDHRTELSLRDIFDVPKRLVLNCNVNQFNQSFKEWNNKNKRLQDAFPYLNADQREFIKIGLTSVQLGQITGALSGKKGQSS